MFRKSASLLLLIGLQRAYAACVDCSDGFCGADSFCYPKFDSSEFTIISVSGDDDVTELLSDGDTSSNGWVIAPGSNYNFHMTFTSGTRYVQFCQLFLEFTGSTALATFFDNDLIEIYGTTRVGGLAMSKENMELTTPSVYAGFILSGAVSNEVYEMECFGLLEAPPTTSTTWFPTWTTPDLCQVHTIWQDCCGPKGYSVRDERINDLVSHGDNCTHNEGMECCADNNDWVSFAFSGGIFDFYCGEDSQRRVPLCEATYFLEKRPDFPWVATNGSLTSLDTNGGTVLACNCSFEFWTCTGNDVAKCGTSSDYQWLTDNVDAGFDWYNVSQWVNDSDWRSQIAAQGKTGDQVDFMGWDACSEESFYGQVDRMIAVSGIDIDDGVCKCQYEFEACGIVPDYEAIYRDKISCLRENITDCCNGAELVFTYDNATKEISSIRCANTPESDFLCPNIFSEDVVENYTVKERKLNWWFDSKKDDFEYLCQCQYHQDICLPTTTTATPTTTTSLPTTTTELPTNTNTEEGVPTTTTTEGEKPTHTGTTSTQPTQTGTGSGSTQTGGPTQTEGPTLPIFTETEDPDATTLLPTTTEEDDDDDDDSGGVLGMFSGPVLYGAIGAVIILLGVCIGCVVLYKQRAETVMGKQKTHLGDDYKPSEAAKRRVAAATGQTQMTHSRVHAQRPIQTQTPAQTQRPAQTQKPVQTQRPVQKQRAAQRQARRPVQAQRQQRPVHAHREPVAVTPVAAAAAALPAEAYRRPAKQPAAHRPVAHRPAAHRPAAHRPAAHRPVAEVRAAPAHVAPAAYAAPAPAEGGVIITGQTLNADGDYMYYPEDSFDEYEFGAEDL